MGPEIHANNIDADEDYDSQNTLVWGGGTSNSEPDNDYSSSAHNNSIIGTGTTAGGHDMGGSVLSTFEELDAARNLLGERAVLSQSSQQNPRGTGK